MELFEKVKEGITGGGGDSGGSSPVGDFFSNLGGRRKNPVSEKAGDIAGEIAGKMMQGEGDGKNLKTQVTCKIIEGKVEDFVENCIPGGDKDKDGGDSGPLAAFRDFIPGGGGDGGSGPLNFLKSGGDGGEGDGGPLGALGGLIQGCGGEDGGNKKDDDGGESGLGGLIKGLF